MLCSLQRVEKLGKQREALKEKSARAEAALQDAKEETSADVKEDQVVQDAVRNASAAVRYASSRLARSITAAWVVTEEIDSE